MFSGALVVLDGGTSYGAFGPDQLPALALVLLDWSDEIYNTGLVFFGFWCAAIGYLIYRSTFLPRLLGLGMALAGLGYATFLYPPLASAVYPFNLAIAVGELALVIWLLVAGVNVERWSALADRPRSAISSAS
jgi:cbb3-type cytochrome oxidase subunit 1